MPVSIERTINRYTAYFRGWCQAFGEHDKNYKQKRKINWLIGEHQVGLIFADKKKKKFYGALLGKDESAPALMLTDSSVRIGEISVSTVEKHHRLGMARLRELIEGEEMLHMFLTYHILYPPGTRIITVSRKRPMGIIYKEVAPLRLILL